MDSERGSRTGMEERFISNKPAMSSGSAVPIADEKATRTYYVSHADWPDIRSGRFRALQDLQAWRCLCLMKLPYEQVMMVLASDLKEGRRFYGKAGEHLRKDLESAARKHAGLFPFRLQF